MQNILNTSEIYQSYKRAAEQLKVNVSVINLRNMTSSYLTDRAGFSPPQNFTYGS